MSSVPANDTSMNSNPSPSARRYYGSPSRRHHESCGDVSYSERPLLQSAQTTPCHRRHYDACPSEAQWNGARAVVHRVQSAGPPSSTTGPPPPPHVDNDDKNDTSSFDGCGIMHFRSQAQRVDVVSRILFPCMFLIFNIIYWPYYLFFCAP